MNIFNRVKLAPKLIALFLLVGLVPLAIASFVAYNQAASAVQDEAKMKLKAIAEIKADRVEAFFSRQSVYASTLADLRGVQEALTAFEGVWDEGIESPAYAEVDAVWSADMVNYAKSLEFDDLLLIDHDGNVVYSLAKEAELGTNLISGPYKDANLADAYKGAAAGTFTRTDYEFQASADDAPRAFVAAPIYAEDGSFHGAIAFQRSIAAINEVMQERTGMGETGDAYLVGPGYMMRSDSRFATESTILKTEVKTEASEAALAGQTDVRTVKDYRGVSVLAAFQPLEIEGLDWVIIAQIDQAELQKPISSLRNNVAMVGVVAGVVIAAAAFLVARMISSPIIKTRDALGAVSTGDMGRTLAVSSRDEIGDMAQSYAKMQSYLSEMAETADRIAKGDLTVEVRPRSDKDTLGSAFARMVQNLGSLVGQVSETSEGLVVSKDQLSQATEQAAGATQDVARVASQVAAGSSQQATSSQEVTQAFETLAQTIEQIAKGAQTQAQAAQEASTLGAKVAEAADQMMSTAQHGDTTVKKTVDGMTQIRTTVLAASKEIATLGERSAEIGKIVSVIDDIAAQTNLLALNAAIEAARAGEQGRGFAVVAEEVRSLAERVAAATKEIAELIGSVQKSVDASVKVMEEGSAEMESGSKLATDASEELQRIVTAAEQKRAQIQEIIAVLGNVNAVVQENLAATEEMQAIATKVGQSVKTISDVAQENSAATQQMAASAQEMSAQVEEATAATHTVGAMADDLRQQIRVFRLGRNGDGRQATGAVRVQPDQGEEPIPTSGRGS
jgi:methyl-accepting chemotaxis protein